MDLGLPLWSTGHPGLRELPPLGLLAACSLTLANYKLAQETVSESTLGSTTTAVSPTGQLKTQQLLASYKDGFHFLFGERQMEAGSGWVPTGRKAMLLGFSLICFESKPNTAAHPVSKDEGPASR